MGAESAEQPAEQMSERHDHVMNLTETSGIQLCAKSFILQAYDVLARHSQRAHSKKPGHESHRSSKRKTARLHMKSGGQVLGQFFARCENDMGNHKRGQLSGGH
jgi:uncharacterized protein with GYD domain